MRRLRFRQSASGGKTQAVRWLRRIFKSFNFAGQGLAFLLRTQPNFVVHCLAATLVITLAVALGANAAETAALLLAIGLVLVCEAFNTALEALVDLVTPRYHELAKIAKDVSAAGVLLAAMVAALVGVVVLGSRLLTLLLS